MLTSSLSKGSSRGVARILGVDKRNINLIVAKEIVCMLTSSLSKGSSKGVARILGVDKRNIRNALERRV
jgi:plasmid maintenance system antidote protein VapI